MAVLRWNHMANLIRLDRLRQRNPDASDWELMALWTEETYRGKVDAGFLARACDAIRSREHAQAAERDRG